MMDALSCKEGEKMCVFFSPCMISALKDLATIELIECNLSCTTTPVYTSTIYLTLLTCPGELHQYYCQASQIKQVLMHCYGIPNRFIIS